MTFLPLRWVRGQASGMALMVTDATTPPAGAGVAPARDATATPGDACRGGGRRCVAALREGGGRRCVAEERDGSWAARRCGRSGRGGGQLGPAAGAGGKAGTTAAGAAGGEGGAAARAGRDGAGRADQQM